MQETTRSAAGERTYTLAANEVLRIVRDAINAKGAAYVLGAIGDARLADTPHVIVALRKASESCE